jgi:hypothetical protein
VFCLVCVGGVAAQAPKDHNPNLTWAPPNTDGKIADLSQTPPCVLDDVMKQAAARANELVDNLQKFDAIEHSQASRIDPDTHLNASDEARFDFVAELSTVNGNIVLKESRQEIDHNDPNAARMEDVGLSALALIFHPNYAVDFNFQCLGAADWDGQPAWVVSFHQIKGHPSRLMRFRTTTGVLDAHLKGRAWIARDSGQIIRLETNLMEPLGIVGLLGNSVAIDYAPVQFHSADVKLWLPAIAIAYSQYDKFTIVKKHTYTDFKLFSVGTQSVIEKPKVPPGTVEVPSSPAPDAQKPAEPAPNEKPQAPPHSQQ